VLEEDHVESERATLRPDRINNYQVLDELGSWVITGQTGLQL
jgi:hypothetical protein